MYQIKFGCLYYFHSVHFSPSSLLDGKVQSSNSSQMSIFKALYSFHLFIGGLVFSHHLYPIDLYLNEGKWKRQRKWRGSQNERGTLQNLLIVTEANETNDEKRFCQKHFMEKLNLIFVHLIFLCIQKFSYNV